MEEWLFLRLREWNHNYERLICMLGDYDDNKSDYSDQY